jgi:hypothetical protein
MSTESSPRPRRTPTDDEIPSLLKSLEDSGGNVSAFAREQGLSPWKLYEARRVAAGGLPRRERRRRARSRRRSARSHSARSEDPEFVAVHLVEEVSPPAPLELVLSGGHRLWIHPGFDELTLRRVVGALGSC